MTIDELRNSVDFKAYSDYFKLSMGRLIYAISINNINKYK